MMAALSPSSPSPSPSPSSMRPRYTSCREHFSSLSPSPSPSSSSSPFAAHSPIAASSSSPFPVDKMDTAQLLPLRPAFDQQNQITSTTSPFLRLPPELRLQIYALLVLPAQPSDLLPDYAKVHRSAQDAFDYDKRQYGTQRLSTADLSRPTLLLRTVDSTHYDAYTASQPAALTRGVYSVRGDRFRARTMPTTYHAVNATGLATRSAASLLRASRQLHAEAAALLYGAYTFDFDTHVEAVVPFLRDLTPLARARVSRLRLVKRALPYEKEFDRAEWAAAWHYLADPASGLLGLRGLELGVVAGRPGVDGWAEIVPYEARDFHVLKEQEAMEWLRPVLALRGLQELNVHAVVEHCPPATNSLAMARFIRFSASVEAGFAEFMRSQLL